MANYELDALRPTVSKDKPLDFISHNEDIKFDSERQDGESYPSGGPLKSDFDDMGYWETAKTFRKASLICLAVAFSAAADGYQIGLTGNVISNKGFIKTYGTTHNAAGNLILAAPVLSAWGGLQSTGQALGMLTQSWLADRFGRKISFYSFWLALVVAVLAETFGRSWPVWLVAKFFAGYAVGALQFVHSMYITEIAPTKIRGFLLLSYSFWYNVGSLMAPLALQRMLKSNPNNYLTLIYTEWAMVGVMILIYLWIPESPWWCAIRGKHEQGREILESINGKVGGYDVDHQYAIIRNTVELENQRKQENRSSDFFSIFKGVDGFRTFISFLPSALQQFTGVAVISTYSSYFFQQAGESDPFLITVILAVLGIVSSLFVALACDKLGRRAMVLSGVSIAWVSLVIIGILGVTPKIGASGHLLVFFACLWKFGNQILGGMSWPYVAETSSSRLRSKTGGFSAALAVAFGLCFTTTVPYMLNANAANWSLKTCFFFAGISAPLFITTWFVIPDTSRRSAAEIDELFERKIRPWRFHKTDTTVQANLRREKGE